MATDTSFDDCLRQVFRKLLQTPQHQPYMFLMQHSQATALRWQATVVPDDAASVYHRAQLRTPQENATRDWRAGTLWLEHLCSRLLLPLILETKGDQRLVWIQTTSRPVPSWLEQQQQNHSNAIRVVEISSADPFGWEEAPELNLNQLENICRAVREATGTTTKEAPNEPSSSVACCPIILESITPIVQRHGFSRTLHFLQRLAVLGCPLMVPVRTETLSVRQHQTLEDLAQSVLWLHDGEATLLRQGIRERDNLVREAIAYDIRTVTDSHGNKRLQLGPAREEIAAEDSKTNSLVDGAAKQRVVDAPSSNNDRLRSKKKVELKLEEDEEAATPSSRAAVKPGPRILVDDDDPEFEDYDEEDPDDDLDI